MERSLALFLRLTAVILLLALPAVFLPQPWMDWIHQSLGMGPMPQGPLVLYLARSESLLYALLGLGYWHIASDPRRYLPLLRRATALFAVFAIGIVGIDIASDMPPWWVVLEGIVLAGWTLAQWRLVREVMRTCPD
jgi:hypothetical protein